MNQTLDVKYIRLNENIKQTSSYESFFSRFKRHFTKYHQCLVPQTSGGRSQGLHVPVMSDVAQFCLKDGGRLTGDEEKKRNVDGWFFGQRNTFASQQPHHSLVLPGMWLQPICEVHVSSNCSKEKQLTTERRRSRRGQSVLTMLNYGREADTLKSRKLYHA